MHMVVGPPTNTNGTSPWHIIVDGPNKQLHVLSGYVGLKPRSVIKKTIWKFASFVATLPSERWNPQDSEKRKLASLGLGLGQSF